MRFKDAPLARPALPDFDRSFLLVVILVAGTVTVPQVVSFGGTSGLGVWTLLLALAAWTLWAFRPYFPRRLAAPLIPITLFAAYSVFSLAWVPSTDPAVQNLAVTLSTLGLLLLTARECDRSPGFADAIHRALDAASLFAGAVYTLTILRQGQGGNCTWAAARFFSPGHSRCSPAWRWRDTSRNGRPARGGGW